MWVNMFTQSLNEFNFMADEAGIKGQIAPKSDHIFVQVDGYADNIENYVTEYFSKLQSFEADEQIYNSLKEQQRQIFVNTQYSEPYSRLTGFLNSALDGENPDLQGQIKILDNMNYEKFEGLRK